MHLDGLRERALVGDRARAQRRAGVGKPLEHDAAEIDACFGAALKGDLHHAPLHRGSLVIALDVVTAVHIENDVGTPAVAAGLGRGNEIFHLIVNRQVGAESAAGVALFGRTGGGDHAGAECFGELDRGGPDPRRAAVDQQGLASL